MQTNKALIRGEIVSIPEVDHECNSVKFYAAKIKAYRLSENYDIVNLIIHETFLRQKSSVLNIGSYVEVEGELRSYNTTDKDNVSHLKVFLYVMQMNIIGLKEECKDINYIQLEGYICRPPTYRITPFGKEITDFMLAVYRFHNKTSYIPCITWGKNARYSSNLNVDDKIKLEGRFQSRKYEKRIFHDMDLVEERETYEVSIQKLTKIT